MHSSLSNTRISGLAVSTGSVVRDFRADGLAAGDDPAQLERVAKAIGLRERRVAAPGVTTLDLCEDAARRLLEEMAVDPTSIDALIFVTQTPDYLQPNNSSLLQARLGLCKSVAAFDITQGCSGWIYGLHQAALLCSHGAARVLVCTGDTLSRQTDPKDAATHPIFGDAGSATLVEKTGSESAMHFIFGTDGSGAPAIMVPTGGARQPVAVGAPGACLQMDGAEVFNFALREVPPAVAGVLKLAGWTPSTTDRLVLHQANRFMVASLARKCGFPDEKCPMDLGEQFGNQSSASIPAALVHACGSTLQEQPLKIAACGYGVGLSWGAAAFTVGPVVVPPMLPFPRH